jgi:hypothetical protein
MRNLSVWWTIMAVGLLFSACWSSEPELKAALGSMGDKKTEWVADSAAASAAWQRAHVWMSRHSATKISVASEAIIQNEKTYDNEGLRYNLSATKRPAGDGRFLIRLEVSGYCPYCSPKPADLQRFFVHYIRTGDDKLDGLPVRIGIK